jgi:UDP-N-acetylmuramoyl-tripeptide--D-alanyl-D-alanine ligase
MKAPVEAAARAMAARVLGDPAREWSGAAIDSRKVRAGELFFALAGTRTDGHGFVAEAFSAGAAAAVVRRGWVAPAQLAGATLLEVEDVLAALHGLTRWARSRAPRALAGITGSTGKTTTKELLAAMLATRHRTARSPGNLNSLYGFPLALLAIESDIEWFVAEMGMSTPGELRRLSELARPDLATITNVRPVHLEFFGSLAAIAEAKAEILDGLDANGSLAVNRDDPEVGRVARRWRGRRIEFGLTGGEVRASEVLAAGAEGSRFRLHVGGARAEVFLPLYGIYNVENCLAAAAMATLAGVGLQDIVRAAETIRPAAMRGVLHRLRVGGGEALLIDDSYNSNPAALERALESAATLPGRRWAVLGEMLELGTTGARLHAEAGERARALGFAPVLGIGALARHLVEGAGDVGVWRASAQDAAAWVARELRAGDVVLVKGSRGVGLETVVAALRGLGQGEAA